MQSLHSIRQTTQVRFSIIQRLFQFLLMNKMWWLVPMIGVLVISFLLLFVAQSSPLGPFIYTLF